MEIKKFDDFLNENQKCPIDFNAFFLYGMINDRIPNGCSLEEVEHDTFEAQIVLDSRDVERNLIIGYIPFDGFAVEDTDTGEILQNSTYDWKAILSAITGKPTRER